MYLISTLGSKLIRSNNQSRATLWVLETCLIARGPDRGLVLGRGAVRMRTVRLGGPLRRNAADARDGEDDHLCGDSSAAPLLDLRRGLKAFMDVLDGMIVMGFLCHGLLSFWSSGIGFLR